MSFSANSGLEVPEKLRNTHSKQSKTFQTLMMLLERLLPLGSVIQMVRSLLDCLKGDPGYNGGRQLFENIPHNLLFLISRFAAMLHANSQYSGRKQRTSPERNSS